MAKKRKNKSFSRKKSKVTTRLRVSNQRARQLADRLHALPIPSQFRRPFKIYRRVSATLSKPISPRLFTNSLAIPNPVCYNRKVRKEIMHALGIAGTRVKPPRYTAKSKVRC